MIRVASCSPCSAAGRLGNSLHWTAGVPSLAFARRAFLPFLPSAALAGRGRPVDAKSPWSAPTAGPGPDGAERDKRKSWRVLAQEGN